MARIFFLILSSLLLLCCQRHEGSINRFSDPVRLKIADFQDKRLADSLYAFFSHRNASYRLDAVQAFASLQDGDVDRIGRLLLMDPEPAVRQAAAFTLGQINHPSCERLLLGALVKEKNPGISFEILQAYGKTTNRWNLDAQAFSDDSVRTAGLAWSLYRAGLRGKTDSLSNDVATRLLNPGLSEGTRLGASHYFARAAKNFGGAAHALINTARNDVSPHVRMAAALSLGKIPGDTSLATLKNIIKSDADPRVIVNSVRALSYFPYQQTKHYLYQALSHENVNVATAASEIILQTIVAADWVEVSSLTNQAKNWRIEANLYEASLKAGVNKSLAEEIKRRCDDATNPYQLAALLGSLKHFPQAYPFVVAKLRDADTAVVRSSAAATLVAMHYSKDFNKKLQGEMAELFRELMKSEEDPAILGSIASALGDSSLNYRSFLKDPAVLYEAKSRLKLPEHNEALQPIESAIAYFEKRKPKSIKNEFNHPINWNLVKRIPEDQKVTIKTTRGNITIRLLVNESPGSVANFVALAQKDYFDDKFFHRVVPNFVVQAGCKRGDGWGSEDYSIRSEFSPRLFDTGSLGMASAGKDTEGTQWFICHSPTPHLDGRYTIFAEVIEGMAVVEYIQVGDKVIDVVFENFPAQ